METTIFLAKLWGPVMLAFGLGALISKSHYKKLYNDVGSESLAILVFGMSGIALGIAQISVHNTWGSPAEVIISILGWALLLKAAIFTIFPQFVSSVKDLKKRLIPFSGLLMIVVGAYLSYLAYIA